MRRRSMGVAVLIALICGMGWSQAAGATAGKESEQLAKMKDLRFLLGHWSGRGWMEYLPGQRRDFSHTETVRSKLGGYVLLIEGLGKNRILGTDEEIVTYEGMGIVSFDTANGSYRYSGYEFNGRSQDASRAFLEDGVFHWGFDDVPEVGHIRFSVTLNDEGQWIESGEVSKDEGTTWRKYFEMTLERQD